MGLVATKAIEEKFTEKSENDFLKVGASSMQGWRNSMEDFYTQKISLDKDRNTSFFAVYDGHGTPEVAKYVNDNILDRILSNRLYSEGKIQEAIEEAFLEIDNELREKIPGLLEEFTGTTAICAFLKENKLYCADIGDSRAILSSKDGTFEILTEDHTPKNLKEVERIKAAGGEIKDNLISGSYALTRAIGDYFYKTDSEKDAKGQIITAFPHTCTKHLTEKSDFLVIASDGIWDALENEQEVLNFIREKLTEKIPPREICEKLLEKCLAPNIVMGGKGCDNMAIVLVLFKTNCN